MPQLCILDTEQHIEGGISRAPVSVIYKLQGGSLLYGG